MWRLLHGVPKGRWAVCEPRTATAWVSWSVAAAVIMALVAISLMMLWRRRLRQRAAADGGARIARRVSLRSFLSRVPGARQIDIARWIALRDMVQSLSNPRVRTPCAHAPAAVRAQIFESVNTALDKHTSKCRIVITMMQMLTQLQVVFVIPYPSVYRVRRRLSRRHRHHQSRQARRHSLRPRTQDFLHWIDTFTNINLLDQSPLGCSVDLSFYTSLVAHTTIPMAVVITLLVARRYTSAKLGTRLVTAAFYIIFFICAPPRKTEHGPAPRNVLLGHH